MLFNSFYVMETIPNPSSQKSRMTSLEESIVIIGGGIAGLATALALHKVGVRSLVLEQSESRRTSGGALLLWSNAWTALESLGIADNLRRLFYELEGVRLCSTSCNAQSHAFVKRYGVEIRCVERNVLMEKLAEALPSQNIRYNSKVISLTKIPNSSPTITEVKLSQGTSIFAKIVIGCDGVNSMVARVMGMGNCTSTRRYVISGMASLPPEKLLDQSPEKWGVQMCGRDASIGHFCCRDNRVFWAIGRKQLPSDDSSCKDPESVRLDALESAKEFPKEVREVIRHSEAETLHLGEVKTRWVWPWKWETVYGKKGCVVLAGDALHTLWPELGHGACLAFEDAVVLARNLSQVDLRDGVWDADKMNKVEAALRKYRNERKLRVCLVSASAYLVHYFLTGSRLFRDMVVLRCDPTFVSILAKFKCGTLPVKKE